MKHNIKKRHVGGVDGKDMQFHSLGRLDGGWVSLLVEGWIDGWIDKKIDRWMIGLIMDRLCITYIGNGVFNLLEIVKIVTHW